MGRSGAPARPVRGPRRPPALSQQRLSLQEDGTLLLRFKRQLGDGRTGITLAPTELLRRLAALVPPPRAHLVRFHGVFAPASSWRAAVVAGADGPQAAVGSAESPSPATQAKNAAPSDGTREAEHAQKAPRRPDAQIPWAKLLLRIFREDVLVCPCGGRRKVTAFIEERKTIEAILGHLGLPSTGPPLSQARGGEGAEGGSQDDCPTPEESTGNGKFVVRRAIVCAGAESSLIREYCSSKHVPPPVAAGQRRLTAYQYKSR